MNSPEDWILHYIKNYLPLLMQPENIVCAGKEDKKKTRKKKKKPVKLTAEEEAQQKEDKVV